MPWNGSGTYSPPAASFPEVNGTVIDAGRYNPTVNDLAAGITNCLAKDGQNSPSANLPMGGYKLTNLAAGTTANDSVAYGQNASFASLTVTGNTSSGDFNTELRTSVPTVTGGAYVTLYDLDNFTSNRCSCKLTIVATENGVLNMTVYEVWVPRSGTLWGGIYSTQKATVGSGASTLEFQLLTNRYFQVRGTSGTFVVQVLATREYFYGS